MAVFSLIQSIISEVNNEVELGILIFLSDFFFFKGGCYSREKYLNKIGRFNGVRITFLFHSLPLSAGIQELWGLCRLAVSIVILFI